MTPELKGGSPEPSAKRRLRSGQRKLARRASPRLSRRRAAEPLRTRHDCSRASKRHSRRPKRAAPGIDPGRVTQSARTGGLLHTASGRQQAKALVDEAVFRRERILDVYHAVESLCFYTAKEMTAQMEVIDGALTLRVPHGPTAMRVVVGDLLAVLPKHLIALKSLTKTQTEAWFPGSDTHWGLESADGLPGYRRRAMTTLETLCEVAASGKHRRLYNAITAEVVSSVQDLARLAALELASKKKIKKKIGQRGVPEEQAAKRAQLTELAGWRWPDPAPIFAFRCFPDGTRFGTPDWCRTQNGAILDCLSRWGRSWAVWISLWRARSAEAIARRRERVLPLEAGCSSSAARALW